MIYRLPEEVLCSIFEMIVANLWYKLHPSFADDVGPEAPDLKLLRVQPFILAAVSRVWRTVARNYPPLWRRVVLDPIIDVDNSGAWASYIALLDELSKQTPTDMVVYLSPIDAQDPMRGSLARLAERARSMLLIGSKYTSRWDLDCFHLMTGSGGRHLESFVLRPRHTLHGTRYQPKFFPEVNKLRTLELDDLMIPWSERDLASVREAKIVLSWRMQLTPTSWQRIFAAIPNAHALFLTLGTMNLPETISQSDLITVSGVRDLVIRGSNERQAGLLRVPQVERVQLEYLDWAALAGHLHDSLGQSGAECLTKITVVNSSFNVDVARGLASIGTLEELDIVECGIQSGFFQALGPDKCPNLREFKYRRLSEAEESGSEPGQPNPGLAEDLFDFVSRRVNANGRLQVVSVPGWLKQWRNINVDEMQSKIDLLLKR